MIIGRQNIALASKDQEEINLYNYCIKKYKFKSDIIGNIEIKKSAKEKSIEFIGRLNFNE